MVNWYVFDKSVESRHLWLQYCDNRNIVLCGEKYWGKLYDTQSYHLYYYNLTNVHVSTEWCSSRRDPRHQTHCWYHLSTPWGPKHSGQDSQLCCQVGHSTCVSTAAIFTGFNDCDLTNFWSFHRNGPEFEARIRQNEINNPKFNFLNPNDPYHAYYRHKVNEFKEGKAQEPSAAIPKVMQQAMQQSQQLPQKVRLCVSFFSCIFFPIAYKWWYLFILTINFCLSIGTGDSRDGCPQRTSSRVWVHCGSPINFGVRSGCRQTHCPVCCAQWPPVSHPAHAERTEELPVWLPAATAQPFQLLHQTGRAVH